MDPGLVAQARAWYEAQVLGHLRDDALSWNGTNEETAGAPHSWHMQFAGGQQRTEPTTQQHPTSQYIPVPTGGKFGSDIKWISPGDQARTPAPTLTTRPDGLVDTIPELRHQGTHAIMSDFFHRGGFGQHVERYLDLQPANKARCGAMPLRDETLEPPPFGPAGEEASRLHPLVDRAESGPEELLPYRLARRG